MADFDVKWFGKELLAKIVGVSESGLYSAADELLSVAQSRAPERSGELKDSGYIATSKRSTYRSKKGRIKQKPVSDGDALAGFSAFYARMVENGTSKMAARPFLRPALDEAKRRAGVKAVVVMRGKLE